VVIVEQDAIEIGVVEGAAPLAVRASGPDGVAVTVRAEPGARYATRRAGEAFKAWERVA
jgi:hypothetical protein